MPGGRRYFRLTLELPDDCGGADIAANYTLNLDGYADNGIVDVFVNGIATGITGGGFSAGTQTQLVLNGSWQPGVNFVDVLVTNAGTGANPYGLLMVASTAIADVTICMSGTQTTICSGESVTITASGANTYVWGGGLGTTDAITVNPTVTTTYTVTGTLAGVNGVATYEVIVLEDNDNDGICDPFDLDDDNDGILDIDECGAPGLVGYPFSIGGGNTETYIFPAADQGFQFDIFNCDNSFNMEINGIKLVSGEVQFCGPPWCDDPTHSLVKFASDGALIQSYQLQADSASPTFRLIIDPDGNVSMLAKRCSTCALESVVIEASDPQFNNITWNNTTTNTVIISQEVVGPTYLNGSGYGVATCTADTDNDGIINSLDLDSDGDGCPDALEGTADLTTFELNVDSSLYGTVTANGVPLIVSVTGQGVGGAQDASVQASACVTCANDNDNDGV
jgi:hypothetical protein